MVRIALALIVILCSDLNAQEYVCIGEHSTGFKYNGRSWDWHQSSFVTARYFVFMTKNSQLEVKTLGINDNLIDKCVSPIENYFKCTDSVGMNIFRLDLDNGKFIFVHAGGYVHGIDSPYVEIGKCFSLE